MSALPLEPKPPALLQLASLRSWPQTLPKPKVWRYFCHQLQYAMRQCPSSHCSRDTLRQVDCQDWRILHRSRTAHFLRGVPHWIAGVLTSPRQRNCKRTHERTVLSARPHPQNNFRKVKPASYWFRPQLACSCSNGFLVLILWIAIGKK